MPHDYDLNPLLIRTTVRRVAEVLHARANEWIRLEAFGGHWHDLYGAPFDPHVLGETSTLAAMLTLQRLGLVIVHKLLPACSVVRLTPLGATVLTP